MKLRDSCIPSCPISNFPLRLSFVTTSPSISVRLAMPLSKSVPCLLPPCHLPPCLLPPCLLPPQLPILWFILSVLNHRILQCAHSSLWPRLCCQPPFSPVRIQILTRAHQPSSPTPHWPRASVQLIRQAILLLPRLFHPSSTQLALANPRRSQKHARASLLLLLLLL